MSTCNLLNIIEQESRTLQCPAEHLMKSKSKPVDALSGRHSYMDSVRKQEDVQPEAGLLSSEEIEVM